MSERTAFNITILPFRLLCNNTSAFKVPKSFSQNGDCLASRGKKDFGGEEITPGQKEEYKGDEHVLSLEAKSTQELRILNFKAPLLRRADQAQGYAEQPKETDVQYFEKIYSWNQKGAGDRKEGCKFQ